jgi:hypothetical protein
VIFDRPHILLDVRHRMGCIFLPKHPRKRRCLGSGIPAPIQYLISFSGRSTVWSSAVFADRESLKISRPRSFSALQTIPAPSANGSDQLLDSATLVVPGRNHTYLWFEYVMIPSSCGEGLPSACLITRTSYWVEGA